MIVDGSFVARERCIPGLFNRCSRDARSLAACYKCQVRTSSLEYSTLVKARRSREAVCPRMKRITYLPHSQLDWESRIHNYLVKISIVTLR